MLYALGLMILRNNLIQRFNLVFEQGIITISFACKKRDSNLVMIATTAMATRYSIFHQTQKTGIFGILEIEYGLFMYN